ncbi:hypothetical protein BROUX41_002329 [Berkeleyomyces rouxiae]
MLVDGQKFACDACIRGHRVSSCQHHDRDLRPINRKGRPVTQCSECRHNRKARAAHVKCDCGEKTAKCVHLAPPPSGHTETCCCNHGGECSCCYVKREPSLSTSFDSPSTSSRRERSTSCQSTKPQPMTMAASSQRRRCNTDSVAQPDHHHQKKIAHRNKMAQQPPLYDVTGAAMPADGAHMLANGDLSVNTSSHHYSRDAYLAGEVPITPGLPTANSVYHHHHQNSGSLATPTGPAPLNMSTMRYPHVNTQFSQPVFDMFSNYDGDMDGPIFSAGLEPGASWHHHSIDSPVTGAANGFLDHEPELSSSIPSLAPNTTDNSPGYGSPDGSATGHVDMHGNALGHGALYHDYGLMFDGNVNRAEPYAVATADMYNESESNPMSDADLFTTMAAEYMESRNGCIAQTGAETNAGLEPIWPTMY